MSDFRLIKKGKIQLTTYKAECGYCGDVWATSKDQLVFGCDRDGEYVQTKHCPGCGKYGMRYEEVIEEI